MQRKGLIVYNRLLEDGIALITGIAVWLVEQAPDEISILSLIYVFFASGAAIAVFRGIVKVYKYWYETKKDSFQRNRRNSRKDLEDIIERQDRLIERLRKRLEEKE